METLLPFLIIFVVIAVIGVVWYYSHLAAKKRTADFEEAAQTMGLTFIPEGGDMLLNRFQRFKLFSRGRGQKITNVITGDAGDIAIAIFDFRFVTGSGKNRTTHNQTIVSMTSQLLNTPDLLIRPQGFFDFIGGALGFQDINFDTHPEFSKMFVLQGSDESSVRAFLVPRILNLLETKQGICLESNGDTLFFYNSRTIIKTDRIKDLMAEAYEIYNCIQGEAVV